MGYEDQDRDAAGRWQAMGALAKEASARAAVDGTHRSASLANVRAARAQEDAAKAATDPARAAAHQEAAAAYRDTAAAHRALAGRATYPRPLVESAETKEAQRDAFRVAGDVLKAKAKVEKAEGPARDARVKADAALKELQDHLATRDHDPHSGWEDDEHAPAEWRARATQLDKASDKAEDRAEKAEQKLDSARYDHRDAKDSYSEARADVARNVALDDINRLHPTDRAVAVQAQAAEARAAHESADRAFDAAERRTQSADEEWRHDPGAPQLIAAAESADAEQSAASDRLQRAQAANRFWSDAANTIVRNTRDRDLNREKWADRREHRRLSDVDTPEAHRAIAALDRKIADRHKTDAKEWIALAGKLPISNVDGIDWHIQRSQSAHDAADNHERDATMHEERAAELERSR